MIGGVADVDFETATPLPECHEGPEADNHKM
jgi:hypothetical protein